MAYNGGAACTNIAALGPDFVDAFALQADELSARRAALQSVDDARLRARAITALPSWTRPSAVPAQPLQR
ncbi:hypothetical protein ULG90_01630 [Halopseudomonas pachastrellae]|nr:hypothetical protein ULG90_01630 [Halopseudomonas pachastrellae]